MAGGPVDDDISIMQLEIEFQSNIRLGIEHTFDQQFFLGGHKLAIENETHVLTFERYVNLPQELRLLKK